LDFFVVDQVGVVGEFLEDQKFGFAYFCIFLFFEGDDFAGEFFVEVVDVVGFDDGGSGAGADYVLLDGVRGALKTFDSYLSLHLVDDNYNCGARPYLECDIDSY
jgi:hypothetical protein